jgi:hypothetical protein
MLRAMSISTLRPTASDLPLFFIEILVPALLVGPATSKILYMPILLLTLLGKLHALLFPTLTPSPLVVTLQAGRAVRRGHVGFTKATTRVLRFWIVVGDRGPLHDKGRH